EEVAHSIIDRGWGLANLHPMPMTLEEIFLQLTTEEELGA
ncbi:MAG: ABC transporter ATP-binding protein, partial [Chloroflexi bacterium]|nr:ABC transporter ATP-binding protein [Chloroflexota bacterium]